MRDLVAFEDTNGDLIKDTAVVKNHIKYDAFGNIKSEKDEFGNAPTVEHIFGFTARERDYESDLNYYRNRYYDPTTGRFLTADPIRDDFENSYRYVNNDPVNNTDPSGLEERKANYYDTLMKFRKYNSELFFDFSSAKGLEIAHQLQKDHLQISLSLTKSLKEGAFDKAGKQAKNIVLRMAQLNLLSSQAYGLIAEKHLTYRKLLANPRITKKDWKNNLLKIAKGYSDTYRLIGNLHKQHALAILDFEKTVILPIVIQQKLAEKMIELTKKQIQIISAKLREGELDLFQAQMDLVGLIPYAGEYADAANASLSIHRGNYLDATFSGMSMYPIYGDIAGKGLKYLFKSPKIFKLMFRHAGKADELGDAIKVLAKQADNIDNIDLKALNSDIIQDYLQKVTDVENLIKNSDGFRLLPKPGTLSNVDARKWYLAQEALILNKIDPKLPLREQAIQAFNMRNKLRTQARDLMSDRKLAEKLMRDEPNMAFQELVRKKYKQKGLTGDALWQDIIDSSQKSRKSVNKKLGLE